MQKPYYSVTYLGPTPSGTDLTRQPGDLIAPEPGLGVTVIIRAKRIATRRPPCHTRTGLLQLLPLSMEELPGKGVVGAIDRLLLSGFYPRIHDVGIDPTQTLGDYVDICFGQDILRQLGNIKDLALFERFLRLCAGRVGCGG